MPSRELFLWRVLKTRLVTLIMGLALTCALLALGLPPLVVAWVTVASLAGAVEVSCLLVMPLPALSVRIGVVVVILVVIVHMLRNGFPPWSAVGLVLGVAFVATVIARRLTGIPYRMPKVIY